MPTTKNAGRAPATKPVTAERPSTRQSNLRNRESEPRKEVKPSSGDDAASGSEYIENLTSENDA